MAEGLSSLMWKVLGKEALPVTIGDTWQERVLELSKRKKGADKFRALVGQAELRYFHDTIKDIHTFMLQFDPRTELEDLQFAHDLILKAHASAKVPVVEYDGEAQRFTVILTAEEGEDDHKKRNAWWGEKGKDETQAL